MTDELVDQQAGIISDEIDASLHAIGAIKIETYKKAVTTAIFGKNTRAMA
jgi:hypothetical protein